MSDNMEYWDKLKRPPASALKTIKAGRLAGMTDCKPQWRYEAMTSLFGACGEGWKYTIDKLWREDGSGGQVMAFAQVSVYFLLDEGGEWSEPIPGIGGSMLVALEKEGKPDERLHTSDEGYKMAVTDALSVALKLLGVAADIYMGSWDGSKYKDEPQPSATRDNAVAALSGSFLPAPAKPAPKPTPQGSINEGPAVTVIKDVQMKAGVGPTGKAWTRYGVVCDNGETYSTFSSTVGGDASQLIGFEVELEWEWDKKSGKYKTVTAIKPMQQAPLVVAPEGEGYGTIPF